MPLNSVSLPTSCSTKVVLDCASDNSNHIDDNIRFGDEITDRTDQIDDRTSAIAQPDVEKCVCTIVSGGGVVHESSDWRQALGTNRTETDMIAMASR